MNAECWCRRYLSACQVVAVSRRLCRHLVFTSLPAVNVSSSWRRADPPDVITNYSCPRFFPEPVDAGRSFSEMHWNDSVKSHKLARAHTFFTRKASTENAVEDMQLRVAIDRSWSAKWRRQLHFRSAGNFDASETNGLAFFSLFRRRAVLFRACRRKSLVGATRDRRDDGPPCKYCIALTSGDASSMFRDNEPTN